ncbi:MAG: DNA protecting protein DprA [Candidatus Taylorbacteria bacterium RIFOXYD2_FULL_36_9]|uniref:DNA protecting protein DprA n=1 Tax=Candidatus Taylorbacteria bacterium RIFOXYD2_FULL_36_9 TaxID=1802338 RepID=A0A1G2PCV8_9BACT|nr:MAG: DNA protecting protein DprA [Candidatus Taylorbacteria bacterium RIFOXYD2_FULL_36_9]
MKFIHLMDQDFPIRELKKKDFPSQLLEIPEPPEKLFIRGDLPGPDTKLLCVVGSRRYTNYGKEVCEKLISGLRGYDVAIVSGLAIGIDGIAHEAAINTGLKTIAIPGSGLGVSSIHPMAHLGLAKKILDTGGCLLSEYEESFKATQYSFPQRNRIMAGLSCAVLIIEAEIKSGTLITSRLATEYNKDVLTVPGNIFSKTSEGPHLLIRLGATPITKTEELLEALGFKNKDSEPRNLELEYAECSPEEKKVINLLRAPMEKDTLLRSLNIPTGQANAVLSVMELKGLIKETLGEIHLT